MRAQGESQLAEMYAFSYRFVEPWTQPSTMHILIHCAALAGFTTRLDLVERSCRSWRSFRSFVIDEELEYTSKRHLHQ